MAIKKLKNMQMKKMLIVFSFLGFVYACGNEASSDKTSNTETTTQPSTDNSNPSYDPERGAGKFTNVDVKAYR